MPFYAFEGFIPVVDPTAFVHPTAVLIGDVVIGPGCYVGPGASLRGDFGRIALDEGANIQDNCVMHSFPGAAAHVEADGHIGHGAILHGCTIGQNALVGMNAVIMDGVILGAESIVGAQAFVRGETVVPPRSMVVGSPAKVIREVTEKEVAWKTRGTAEYQQLARDCLAGLKPVAPLGRVEENRPEMAASDVVSIQEARRQPN